MQMKSANADEIKSTHREPRFHPTEGRISSSKMISPTRQGGFSWKEPTFVIDKCGFFSGCGIGTFPTLRVYRLACARCPRRRKQSPRTVFFRKLRLLPPGSNPYIIFKKTKTTRLGGFVFWQRDRDSNPNKQSQSLSCYRYTIPLGREILYYYNFRMSIVYSKFFRKNFIDLF